MNKYDRAYIILYNDYPSQEGYSDIKDAIKYCADRGVKISEWTYMDAEDGIYKIKEILILKNKS